jgi:hypothetical protein
LQSKQLKQLTSFHFCTIAIQEVVGFRLRSFQSFRANSFAYNDRLRPNQHLLFPMLIDPHSTPSTVSQTGAQPLAPRQACRINVFNRHLQLQPLNPSRAITMGRWDPSAVH